MFRGRFFRLIWQVKDCWKTICLYYLAVNNYLKNVYLKTFVSPLKILWLGFHILEQLYIFLPKIYLMFLNVSRICMYTVVLFLKVHYKYIYNVRSVPNSARCQAAARQKAVGCSFWPACQRLTWRAEIYGPL